MYLLIKDYYCRAYVRQPLSETWLSADYPWMYECMVS